MLELIYVEKILKFYLDLIAGSKGLNPGEPQSSVWQKKKLNKKRSSKTFPMSAFPMSLLPISDYVSKIDEKQPPVNE